MQIKDLSVRAKLTSGFGILVAVVVAVSALSINALGNSNREYKYYVEETGVRLSLANDVLDAASARAIAARNLVLVQTPADRDAEKKAVDQAHTKLGASLKSLKEALAKHHDVSDSERKLVADFEAVESRYGPVALEIVKLAVTDKREEAIRMMNADCRPLLAGLLNGAGAYLQHVTQGAAVQVKQAEGDYTFSRVLLLIACAVASALGIGLSLLITRSLTKALGAEPNQLGAIAERVAQGDLSPVDGVANAPSNSVLASLAHMQSSLAGVVSQVRSASDSIATGSTQIASGNADLSQRTEEQASNLQQTAASMEQLNSTVKHNADTARQANQLATSASSAAELGGQVVGRVVSTMDEITAASKKISDIIGVIDGIAFQTNILALNAAVEAARAGEQGRGFAVVASEVRNLAQRSADAAKEIKALINASVEKVEAGTALVGDAGASMTDIVGQVKRVADLIAEISSATIEQTSGISQVSHAVNQLDQVTQQNAALVEESAAAAESLKHQAHQLTDAVAVFKLGTEHASPPMGAAAPSATHRPKVPAAKSRPASHAPLAKPAAPAPARAQKPAAPATAAAGADWESF